MRILAVAALWVVQALAAALGRVADVQWRQNLRYEPGVWCEVAEPDDHLVIYLDQRGQPQTLRSRLDIQRLGFFVVVEEQWCEGPSGVTVIFRADREITGADTERVRAAIREPNLGLA